MEETQFEPITFDGMDKCATVYRSDSASFIYVCYHCGTSFTDIECTLQHVEIHFRLVEITIEENSIKYECIESAENTDNDCDVTNSGLEMKREVEEIDEDRGDDSLQKSITWDCQLCDSVFLSKFSFRCHLLREHSHHGVLECDKCEKSFKRDANFEKHLRKHIRLGEVHWTCTGDGIREPIKSPKKSGNANTPKEGEMQLEKRQSQNQNKTALVRSKQKTRQISTYICHKCSETFSSLITLNDHFNTHSTEDMLEINKCKKCKNYFPSAFNLRLHVLEIHYLVNEFKCFTCAVGFKKKEKSLFQKHLEIHLANNSASWANIWQGICDNGNDLTNYEDVTTITESSCEFCEEKFFIKSNLDEHIRCVHFNTEQELRCPQCDAVFTKLRCYFAHQLEHRRVGSSITETDMNLLVANLNSFIDEQCLHNATENASNPYKCSICCAERKSHFEIRRHVRDRHVYKSLPQPIRPNVKDRITCNVCGMDIKRKSFRSHLMTHSDIKSHSCSTCSKTFRTSFAKITHERLHTGEKPFQCDQCGKRFFSNSLLGAHQKCHDNTVYPCKLCGRVFNVPASYRRHIQIHRKDKSFECTVCLKSFNTRVYLSRHMFKHSEKKYQCSFCETKFNTANGLKQHEKSKHNYEPT